MLAKSFVSYIIIFAIILAQEPPLLAAKANEQFFHVVNLPTDTRTSLLQIQPSQFIGDGARGKRQVAGLPAESFFDLTNADYEGKRKQFVNKVEGILEAERIEQVKRAKRVNNLNDMGFRLDASEKLVNFLFSLPPQLRKQLKSILADDGAVFSQVADARNAQQPAPVTLMRATMNSGLRRR